VIRRLLVLAAAAAALSLILAAPAAARGGQLFGISKGNQGPDAADFQKMRQTGVHGYRFVVNWGALQPRRGSPPRFAAISDHLIGNLAARGIRPAPFVYGSPPWVARRPNIPPLQNLSERQAWQRFLTLFVNRYGPGGGYWSGKYRSDHPGARPLAVSSVQIWNEPNLAKFFPRRRGPAKYGQLVTLADRAISGANRSVKVVLAGLTGYADPTAWKFLGKLYRVNGIKRHFDAAALHPYAATIGQFKRELAKVRKVIKRHHDRGTELWLSEVGWGSERPSRNWPLNKGTQGQKRMLKKSFRYVLKKRRALKLERLFWFNWRDPRAGARVGCSFCDSAGLLRHNRRAKPAYEAFRSFAR
jgi:hypothetical protein